MGFNNLLIDLIFLKKMIFLKSYIYLDNKKENSRYKKLKY